MIGQLTLLGLFVGVVICAFVVALGPHGVYRKQKPDPWDAPAKESDEDRRSARGRR